MFHVKLYLRGFAAFCGFKNNITSCTVQGNPVTSDIWPLGKEPKGSCEKPPPLPDNKVWGFLFRLLLFGAAGSSLLQTLHGFLLQTWLISAPTSAQDSLTALLSVSPAVWHRMSLPPQPSTASITQAKFNEMVFENCR